MFILEIKIKAVFKIVWNTFCNLKKFLILEFHKETGSNKDKAEVNQKNFRNDFFLLNVSESLFSVQ